MGSGIVVQLLKRHPYAATFVGLLLVCSMIDWTSWAISEDAPPWERYYGLDRGHFVAGSIRHTPDITQSRVFYTDGPGTKPLHFPNLGRKLEWGRGSFPTIPHWEMAIPIYLPLLAVMGWVTFRELRRRKI